MFETEPFALKYIWYCVMELYPGVLILKAEYGLVMVQFFRWLNQGKAFPITKIVSPCELYSKQY